MNNRSQHPDELLPWYVNGTLAGTERDAVETHLAACERCRGELRLLTLLRQQVKRAGGGESPGELARLKLLHAVRQSARRRLVWPLALAAALAVVAVQTVLLVNLWRPEPQAITPLGSLPGHEAVLQVRFAPQATEPQMRAVLNEVNAVLIDGPGPLGLYRVRLEGLDSTQRDELEAAAAKLKSRGRVVRHVAIE